MTETSDPKRRPRRPGSSSIAALSRRAVLLAAALCAVAAPARAQQRLLLRGDVDGDGAVTSADALAILHLLSGRGVPVTFRAGRVADADGDGAVTRADAELVTAYAVGNAPAASPVAQQLPTAWLTPDSVSLAFGFRVKLGVEVTGTPELRVTWRSETPALATVDSTGTVTALAPGRAVISAIPVADSGGIARAVLRIGQTQLAELRADADSLLLAAGDSARRHFSARDSSGVAIPALPVQWGSTDPSRVQVSPDGEVRAVAPGHAVVWVAGAGLADSMAVRVVLLRVQADPAAGGVATSASGGVTLTVPPGAVDSARTVWIDAAPPGAVPDSLGALAQLSYVAGPAGLRLSAPATLAVRVPEAAIPQGLTVEELGFFVPGAAGWERLAGGAVDVARRTLRAPVTTGGTLAVLPLTDRLELAVAADTLERDETVQLNAVLYAANGTELHGRRVFWSSSVVAVATVSTEGVVKAVSPGTTVIVASRGSARDSTILVVASPAPSQIDKTAGDGGVDTVTATRAVRLRVSDAAGRPVAGVRVRWAADAGSGAVTPDSVDTDAQGAAGAAWTLGAAPGPQHLRAWLAGSDTVVFTVDAAPGAAALLRARTQPSPSARAGAPLAVQPALEIADAHGNVLRVAGTRVEAAVAGGGATLSGPAGAETDAEGVARFSGLSIDGPVGAYTLTFTAAGIPALASDTVRLAAGAAAEVAKVSGDSQTVAAGRLLPARPSVRVRDASGNPVVGVTVTFSVEAGGGAVIGASPRTDAAGVASVGGWSLGSIGANALAAAVEDVPPVRFSALAIPSGAVLAADSGSGGSAAAGAMRSVRARLVDGVGAPRPGEAVEWSVTTGGGSVSPARGVTDAAGYARAEWTLGAAVGPQGLRALAPGADSAQASFVLTVSGAASGLIDVVRDFGAVADGTDAEPRIQAALDSAAARGGGVVRLPAGTYGLALPLIVRSNVHLTGDGMGRTVLRSLVPLWGKTVDGAEVYAAAAMVAASHASVTNLTIDFAAANTHSNGVAMLPDGAGYGGTPSSDCEVSNVEVIGGGNFHAYLIWNLRGRRIRIVNNRIDGRIAAGSVSAQEGIESLAGKDVLIAGNDVRNVGANGIFAVSGGAPGDEEERVQVTGNHVAASGNGITVSQILISADGPGIDVRAVTVEGNVVEGTWWTGIKVQLFDPGRLDGLRIRGNRVSGVGLAGGEPGHGIYMAATEALSRNPSRVHDVVVEENQIGGTLTGDAIRLLQFPAVTVRGNEVSGAGILAATPDSVVITGNTVRGAGGTAIRTALSPNRAWITDNTVLDWARVTAGQPAVSVENAAAGARVRGNRFGFAGADPPAAVKVDPSSGSVVVFGNELLDEWGAGDPFVNAGYNANLGSFEAAAGQATLEVSAAVAKATSTIVIVQVSGAPIAATATPGAGGFAVRFATPPVGGERFRYEIDP